MSFTCKPTNPSAQPHIPNHLLHSFTQEANIPPALNHPKVKYRQLEDLLYSLELK